MSDPCRRSSWLRPWESLRLGRALFSVLLGRAWGRRASIHLVQHYPLDVRALAFEVLERKPAWRQIGGLGAWFQGWRTALAWDAVPAAAGT